jgi:hypothetical protein
MMLSTQYRFRVQKVDRENMSARPIPAEIYDKGVADALEASGAPCGFVQFIFVSQGRWEMRVGPFASWSLAMMNPVDEQQIFTGVTVIAPPGSVADEVSAKLADSICAHRSRWSGEEPPAGAREGLARSIEVIVVEEPSVDDIASALAGVGRCRAVAVIGVDGSAPVAGDSANTDGVQTATTKLAQLASAIAGEKELFVIVDTARSRPTRALSETLRSIRNTSIFSADAERPGDRLAMMLPDWRRLVRGGDLTTLLGVIEELPDLSELDRAVLRIDVLDEANLGNAALEAIRALDPAGAMTADQAARISLIAANAGGTDTATTILQRHLPDFDTQTELETALRAAQRATEDVIAAELQARLEEDHPSSPLLAQTQYRAAVKRCDHRAAHDHLARIAGAETLARMHLDLAGRLGGDGDPDYPAIVASAADSEQEKVRTECARHANKQGRHNQALTLLLAREAVAARTGTFALCDALDGILLHRRQGGALSAEDELIQEAFDALTERLGDDTGDQLLRVRLLDMIEPSVSGSLGRKLALSALKRARRQPATLTKGAAVENPVGMADLLAIAGFTDKLRRWIDEDGPLRVGRSTFPLADLPAAADQICEGILHDLNCGARRISVKDMEGLLLILAFGAAAAAHALTPNLDLPMIRVASIGLALGGLEQPARDTIETALEISATPERCRLAWLGMADVYSRTNQNLVAALYAASGLGQGDGEIDERQYWHETLVTYRIQRELGAFGDAEESLSIAESLLEKMGRAEMFIHQIETNRIALEMKKARGGISVPDFSKLLLRMVINAEAVIGNADEGGPAAVLLTQMIRQGREIGAEIPADADAVIERLKEREGGALAELAEALGRDIPTTGDLLALIRQSSGQRYSADVGTDAKALAMTARRALQADDTLLDTDTACLALEMTCDRALAVPGWTDAKAPPAAPSDEKAVTDALRRISANGTAVLLSGLAEDGTLVSVRAVNGSIGTPVREDSRLFSRPLLDEWGRDYPFLYGSDDRPANAFLTTTDKLRLSSLPPGPLLLIRDSRMASFPPSLLRAGPYGSSAVTLFAGAERPVSSAPSVLWLEAAMRYKSLGDGRRLAWMPGGGTMKAIAEYSSGPFTAHHVELDDRERLPDYFRGASLAIVAAHGKLNPDGGAFQVVSSEGSVAVTGGDLARSLHNVGVVILFVCSGGRSDKHPAADATIGLARDVLDQGAQAVVASPWPLESLVPPRWIDTFLRKWDQGDRLADAVHAANIQLFARDHNPEKGLAMNIFGNPFVRA